MGNDQLGDSAGSIPANAGEPACLRVPLGQHGVYPRERGGTAADRSALFTELGLSPRTRGNLAHAASAGVSDGSIPANAGEPVSVLRKVAAVGVYPRERGGTSFGVDRRCRAPGLSPRTRGNPPASHLAAGGLGSIPANAGEPLCSKISLLVCGVYPRERGGTRSVRRGNAAARGLSPRTRGNPRPRKAALTLTGSIPANAGEPTSPARRTSSTRVYPRERGGTACWPSRTPLCTGLSPRTRGNPGRCHGLSSDLGSIPANAGEPACSRTAMAAIGVYPRERGGTATSASSAAPTRGLSPRTRGNRCSAPTIETPAGSIPANAGEPPRAAALSFVSKVYPRERGGTWPPRATVRRRSGLSPRTRGNPSTSSAAAVGLRSIPANAGEPRRLGKTRSAKRVYPRERGGTRRVACLPPHDTGLSPRTRGNPPSQQRHRSATRSIPANAGEPRRRVQGRRPAKVYPRERGGTRCARCRAMRSRGLSPRTRGNRRANVRQPGVEGSIPANAGEPC